MTQLWPLNSEPLDDLTGGLGPRPAYPIESVDNALKLLGLFRKRKLVRVSEAADALGIARSTAHRLIAMLQYHGFVRQDPLTKAYVAGRALLDLGLATVQGLDIRVTARPELERLSRQLEETVFLMILDGRSTVVIDSVESTRALRVGSRTGIVTPAHCTAGGKALLAELSREQLHRLLGDVRLERPTPRTLASLADLERDLARIRERGYATCLEEIEPGLASVGAALRAPALHPPAAISLAAPAFRLTRRESERVAAALLETARAVSEQAGENLRGAVG